MNLSSSAFVSLFLALHAVWALLPMSQLFPMLNDDVSAVLRCEKLIFSHLIFLLFLQENPCLFLMPLRIWMPTLFLPRLTRSASKVPIRASDNPFIYYVVC